MNDPALNCASDMSSWTKLRMWSRSEVSMYELCESVPALFFAVILAAELKEIKKF